MAEAGISDYFYGDEAEQFIYFRIPRLLITDPRFKHLSTDAKLLYGMLLDRMSLSVKNGWYDEDGRVYIYYTVEEICDDMNFGRDKAMKMLADLDTRKGVGLINRIKQGQGKPTKLYVRRFTTGSIPPQPPQPEKPPFIPSPDIEFSGVQTSDFPTSTHREIRLAGVEKTDPNYTKLNHPDFNHPDPSTYPPSPQQSTAAAAGRLEMERYEQREQVKENIDYSVFRDRRGCGLSAVCKGNRPDAPKGYSGILRRIIWKILRLALAKSSRYRPWLFCSWDCVSEFCLVQRPVYPPPWAWLLCCR